MIDFQAGYEKSSQLKNDPIFDKNKWNGASDAERWTMVQNLVLVQKVKNSVIILP